MASYFTEKKIVQVVYSVMASNMELFHLYFKGKERGSVGSGLPKDHTALWNNHICYVDTNL